MYGKLESDAKGFVIETLYTMSDEPTMIVSRYRVNVMNGQPRSDSADVTFNGSWWSGYGFQCNTEPYAESSERVAIKQPRGMKVWRDSQWRKY